MSKVIFHIEDRASQWIYHWLIYMISGLRFIPHQPSKGHDGSGKWEQNLGQYQTPTPPYYLYFPQPNCKNSSLEFNNYQLETLELMGPLFQVITREEINADDVVINNYGEYIIDREYHIDQEGYNFVRSLLQVEITDSDRKKYEQKKFYLSRNRSHELPGNTGVKRRQLLNEQDLLLALKPYDVEGIFLEDYPVREKIKIFQLAKQIISPSSGGLVFTLFSTKDNKIVELNVAHPHQISRTYQDQCRHFKIPYHKFICDQLDNDDNMIIDIPLFLRFLEAKGLK